LLRLDLLTNEIAYDRPMPVGVDSFDIAPDGKTLYLPDGDGQDDGIWRVVDTATGTVKTSIETGGHNPQNTIVSLQGAHVYMGPRLSNYMVEADTSANHIIRRIGPLKNGVRPFTIKSDAPLSKPAISWAFKLRISTQVKSSIRGRSRGLITTPKAGLRHVMASGCRYAMLFRFAVSMTSPASLT
jgi:hypothetical protein